jgi:hypothetical protein
VHQTFDGLRQGALDAVDFRREHVEHGLVLDDFGHGRGEFPRCQLPVAPAGAKPDVLRDNASELDRIRQFAAHIRPMMQRHRVLEDFGQTPRFQDEPRQFGMVGSIRGTFVTHQVQAVRNRIVHQPDVVLRGVLEQRQLSDSVEQAGGVMRGRPAERPSGRQ